MPGAANFTQINGINNAGVLVGEFVDPATGHTEGFSAVAGTRYFLATLSVFGPGLLAMSAIRRRRAAR